MIQAVTHTFLDARILVVDDKAENVQLVARFLEWAGYHDVNLVTDSKTVMDVVSKFQPDIILLDLHMPAPNGYELLAMLRAQNSSDQFIPVLVFTADATTEARTKALEAGASDFLTKPGDAAEILLRVRNFLDARRMHVALQQLNHDLEERVHIRTAELYLARQEAVEMLARAGEFRDDDTGQHTRRVGILCASIAAELGAPGNFVADLRLAALLHDVGKISLPDAILLKPGRLDDEELKVMRTHTLRGAEVFSGIQSPLMTLAREIALNHHERWDGSGYPNGIAGEEIPLSARIVSVADVYDALVNERPYKKAWSHESAVSEIASQSGTQFDPRVVEAFLALMDSQDIQAAA